MLKSFDRFITALLSLSWLAIGLNFVFLYVLGALVLGVVEARESHFSNLAEYTWWFFVTITTVGYGDMAPATNLGRFTAILIMLFGIGSIGVMLGKVGEIIFETGRRRMRGLVQLNERNHIVIFGYRPEETDRMIEEIKADRGRVGRTIVLVSNEQAENPIPGEIEFVHGRFTTETVLARACLADAELVIIDQDDDAEAIVTAIAVNAVNADAHVVVHLRELENERHIKQINERIEVVLPIVVPMMVQAMQDPGVTRIIQQLLSNFEEDVIYKIAIPHVAGDRVGSFGSLLSQFKSRYDAILLGVAESSDQLAKIRINPPDDHLVAGGMALFYVRATRLTSVDWEGLSS